MPSPQRRSSRANKSVAPVRFGSWLTRAGSKPDLFLFTMSAESATASSCDSDSESNHDQTIVEQPEVPPVGAQGALPFAEEMEGAIGGLLHSHEKVSMVQAASPVRTSSSRSSSVGGRSSSSRQDLIADLNEQLQTNMYERNELRQSRMQVELAFAEYKRQHLMAVRDAGVNAPPTTTSSVQSHVAVSSSHPHLQLQLQRNATITATTHASQHASTSTPTDATPGDQTRVQMARRCVSGRRHPPAQFQRCYCALI